MIMLMMMMMMMGVGGGGGGNRAVSDDKCSHVMSFCKLIFVVVVVFNFI